MGFTRTPTPPVTETPTTRDLSDRDSNSVGRHWVKGNHVSLQQWSAQNELSILRAEVDRLKRRRGGADEAVAVGQFLQPFSIYQLPDELRQSADKGDKNKFWVRAGRVAYRRQYRTAEEVSLGTTLFPPHPTWVDHGNVLETDGVFERLASAAEEPWKKSFPSDADYPLAAFTLDPVDVVLGSEKPPKYVFYVEMSEDTPGEPVATVKASKVLLEYDIIPQLVLGYVTNHWDPDVLFEEATKDWVVHQSRVGDVNDYHIHDAWNHGDSASYPTTFPFYETDRMYYKGSIVKYTTSVTKYYIMMRTDTAVSGIAPTDTDYWATIANPAAT